MRSIGVALRARDVVEVSSGLEVGERVVVYPGERVVEGVEVEIRR